MMPVLPGLSSLSGSTFAGRTASGATIRTMSKSGTTARTSTSSSSSNANSSFEGINSDTLSSLQGYVEQLAQGEQRVNSINAAMDRLNTNTQGANNNTRRLGDNLKNAERQGSRLATAMSKVKNFLFSAVKYAGMLVMAISGLGLAVIGSGLSKLWGESKDQISRPYYTKEWKAWNRANELSGSTNGEFDLMRLQELLGTQESYGVMSQLGLSRDAIAELDPISAMQEVSKAIGKKLKEVPENSPIWNELMSAIQKSSGVNVATKWGREKFSDEKIAQRGRDTKRFAKMLPDREVYAKTQKAIMEMQWAFEDLREEMAVSLAPIVIKIANTIRDYLRSDAGKKAIEEFKKIATQIGDVLHKVINKIKEVFTPEMLGNIIKTIGNLTSSFLNLAQVALPLLLHAFNGLAMIIEEVTKFLRNPAAYIVDTALNIGDAIGDIISGTVAKIGGYGRGKAMKDEFGNYLRNDDGTIMYDPNAWEGNHSQEFWNEYTKNAIEREKKLKEAEQNKVQGKLQVEINLKQPDGSVERREAEIPINQVASEAGGAQ